MDKHECKTYDGVTIRLGLKVIDYDNKPGTVVCVPDTYDLTDDKCWPEPGHNGHWWGVCRDREEHSHNYDELYGCRGKIFDGSRLLARGRGW